MRSEGENWCVHLPRSNGRARSLPSLAAQTVMAGAGIVFVIFPALSHASLLTVTYFAGP
jgi:hypothetical protein